MKKKYILCVIPILILLIVTVWVFKKEFPAKQTETSIQKIGESPALNLSAATQRRTAF